MRRSAGITLSFVATVALAACARQEDETAARQCVDTRDQRVVSDAYCDRPGYGGLYGWYYGGRLVGAAGQFYARGGSYTAPSTARPAVRGGFGSTARGHSAAT